MVTLLQFNNNTRDAIGLHPIKMAQRLGTLLVYPCIWPLVLTVQPQPLFSGVLTRVISCELQYGPMNCDFAYRGSNSPVFDEVTLPLVRRL